MSRREEGGGGDKLATGCGSDEGMGPPPALLTPQQVAEERVTWRPPQGIIAFTPFVDRQGV